jgi:hypothetical protein
MRAGSSYPLKRFNAWHVGGDEIREIELRGVCLGADFQEFRDLGRSQLADDPHDSPVDFLDNADPAIHYV